MTKNKYKIDIIADASKALSAFEKTNKSSQKLGKSTKKLGGESTVATAATKLLNGSILGIAAAAGSTAVSFVNYAVSIARANVESVNFARIMGTSVEQYKAIDLAARQYGMTGEQVADITKDIKDKAQEFARDATGPFMDVANQMGLTKKAAKEMAAEMVKMSGPDSIGLMVSKMEDLGLTSDQMTQALESMGNDLSRLTPLFMDGSKEANRLADSFAELTVPLNESDIQAYKNLSKSVDLASASFSSLMENKIAPFLDYVTGKTEQWAHLFASFNEGSEAQITSRLADIKDRTDELTEAIENNATGWGRLKNVSGFESLRNVDLEKEKNALLKERAELLEELHQQEIKQGIWNDPNKKPKAEPETPVITGPTTDQITAAEKLGESLKDSVLTPIEAAQKEYDKTIKILNNAYKENSDEFINLEAIAAGKIKAVKEEQAKSTLEKQKAITDETIKLSERELQQKVSAAQFMAAITGDETELHQIMLDQKLAQLKAYYDNGLILDKDYQKAKAQFEAEKDTEKQQSAFERIKESRNKIQENARGQLDFESRISDEETAENVKKGQDLLAETAKTSKAAFEIQKGMKISAAMMNTYDMAVGAYDAMASIPYIGPALGVAAAAAATAYGFMQVKGIKNQKFQGKADSGIDSVPGTGNSTWILKGKERVVQPEANKKLTKFLDDEKKGKKQNVDFNYSFVINGNVTDEEWFSKRLVEHEELITDRVLETLLST